MTPEEIIKRQEQAIRSHQPQNITTTQSNEIDLTGDPDDSSPPPPTRTRPRELTPHPHPTLGGLPSRDRHPLPPPPPPAALSSSHVEQQLHYPPPPAHSYPFTHPSTANFPSNGIDNPHTRGGPGPARIPQSQSYNNNGASGSNLPPSRPKEFQSRNQGLYPSSTPGPQRSVLLPRSQPQVHLHRANTPNTVGANQKPQAWVNYDQTQTPQGPGRQELGGGSRFPQGSNVPKGPRYSEPYRSHNNNYSSNPPFQQPRQSRHSISNPNLTPLARPPPSGPAPLFDPSKKGPLWESSENNTSQSQPPPNPHLLNTSQGGNRITTFVPASSSSSRTHEPAQQPRSEGAEDDEASDLEIQVMPPGSGVPIVPGDPSLKFGGGGGGGGASSSSSSGSGSGSSSRHFQFLGSEQRKNQQGQGPGSRGSRSGGGTKNLRTTGGGGKVRADFHGDPDELDGGSEKRNGNGKGKGKEERPNRSVFSHTYKQVLSTNNVAKGGKGSSSKMVEGGSMQPPSLKKGGGSAAKRVILQDDSQEQQAAQLVQATLEKRAAAEGHPFRINDDHQPLTSLNVKGAAGTGKGKGKQKQKEPEVLELSSDEEQEQEPGQGERSGPSGFAQEEEDDSDEIQDPDDPPGKPSTSTSTSSRRPTNPNSNPKTTRQQLLHHHPQTIDSSDDLAMDVPQGFERREKNQTGNVQKLRRHFEEKSSKVATSLGTKGSKKPLDGPSLDGAGNEQYGMDELKVSPTSINGGTKKKNKKPSGGPPLDPVIELAIKPFMLAKVGVPPHDDHVEYFFKFNTTGKKPKDHKITILRKPDEEIVDFKLDEVQMVEWMTLPSDGANAIACTFEKKKGPKIMRQLGDDWLTLEEMQLMNSPNEFFIVSRGQTLQGSGDDWEHDPSTAFGKILYCLKTWSGDDESKFRERGSASAHDGIYAKAVMVSMKNSRGDARMRLQDRTGPTTSKSSKPKDKNASLQATLIFPSSATGAIPGSNFYNNNNTQAAPSVPSTDSRTTRDRQDVADSAQKGPRRSSRQSTSIYKETPEEQRRIAPVRDPYPSDYVVLEYPVGEPGSVTVTYGDKKRLNDDEFLNDTLIEFGLKKAMVDVKQADQKRAEDDKIAPVTHVFNSFFYKKLSTGKHTAEDKQKGIFGPHELVEKWTKKFNFFDKKYVVIPINEHLHWYLAVIVNPRWILDNAPSEAEVAPVPSPHITRGRISTTTSDPTKTVTLDSSSQPQNDKSPYFSTTTKNDEEVSDNLDVDEEELEARHRQQEEKFQEKIVEEAADPEMGVAEAERDDDEDDGDLMMVDPSVEGGGNKNSNSTSNSNGTAIMTIDDDDELEVRVEDSQPSIDRPQPVASTSTAAPKPRVGVPIGVPTSPPKGAWNPPPPPPPQPQPESSEQMEIDSVEKQPAAVDIARELGADPTLSNKCWIFTFDSLGGTHEAVVEKLKKYIAEEARKKLGVKTTAIEQVKGIAVQVPRQPNFCDCGLYLLHFVEKFLANPLEMTRYIVSTEVKPRTIKGAGEEIKRRRAEQKAKKAQLDAAIDREDRWKALEAREKRKTMRGEVEGLMKIYEPIKKEKDAKELEEKKAKEKKREEREREKERRANENLRAGPAGSTEMERKKSREEQPQTVEPRGKKTRGKKAPTVITLDSSDDDEEERRPAGSPEKKKPVARQAAPPVPPPPPANVVPTSSKPRGPTAQDFLPQDAPAAPSHRPQQNGAMSLSPLYPESAGGGEEESGDLDNTQENENDTEMNGRHSGTSPLSSPGPGHTPGRPLDTDDSNSSPPKKKRKKGKKPQILPKRSTLTQPTSPHSARREDLEEEPEEEEEEDQLDSSIEVGEPRQSSPVFEQPPPANQEQLIAAQRSRSVSPRRNSTNRSVNESLSSPRRTTPRDKQKDRRETLQID